MSNNYISTLGKILRDIRKHTPYTIESAANALGKSKNWLGGIERGERNIYVEDFLALMDLYDYDPNEALRRAKAKQ